VRGAVAAAAAPAPAAAAAPVAAAAAAHAAPAAALLAKNRGSVSVLKSLKAPYWPDVGHKMAVTTLHHDCHNITLYDNLHRASADGMPST
jgi:hypothetical protein